MLSADAHVRIGEAIAEAIEQRAEAPLECIAYNLLRFDPTPKPSSTKLSPEEYVAQHELQSALQRVIESVPQPRNPAAIAHALLRYAREQELRHLHEENDELRKQLSRKRDGERSSPELVHSIRSPQIDEPLPTPVEPMPVPLVRDRQYSTFQRAAFLREHLTENNARKQDLLASAGKRVRLVRIQASEDDASTNLTGLLDEADAELLRLNLYHVAGRPEQTGRGPRSPLSAPAAMGLPPGLGLWR